jgi:hypothetical protein
MTDRQQPRFCDMSAFAALRGDKAARRAVYERVAGARCCGCMECWAGRRCNHVRGVVEAEAEAERRPRNPGSALQLTWQPSDAPICWRSQGESNQKLYEERRPPGLEDGVTLASFALNCTQLHSIAPNCAIEKIYETKAESGKAGKRKQASLVSQKGAPGAIILVEAHLNFTAQPWR